jgi:hypothetical protein
MKQNWVRIFSSNELIQVKIAEDILKQNGIVSHIISKPDSAIPALGEAELYTLPENAERASELLKEYSIK